MYFDKSIVYYLNLTLRETKSIDDNDDDDYDDLTFEHIRNTLPILYLPSLSF